MEKAEFVAEVKKGLEKHEKKWTKSAECDDTTTALRERFEIQNHIVALYILGTQNKINKTIEQ